MKKLMALALCAALLAGVCLPASAMVVSTTAYDLDGTEAVQAAAALGDTIYFTTDGNAFFSRKAGSPDATPLGLAKDDPALPGNLAVNAMFAWNGKLYALSIEDGAYYSVLGEGGELALALQEPKLDTSALVEKDGEVSYVASVTSLFVQGDYLYYTSQSFSQSFSAVAGRVSLTTGASQTFATPNILSLSPYEDGKLAAYLFDASALYSMDSSAVEGALRKAGDCVVFDPEKDAVETSWPIETDNILGGMSIAGLCYGNGTVYFGSGSRIMGMDMATGETRVSGYTGEGIYGGAATGAVVGYAEGGYYFAYGSSGLSVYRLDGENLKGGALRIYGELMGSEAHKSFTRNYPDIPVEVAGEYTASLEALTQAMVTENDPYDVLLLSLNYMPVDRLLKKGYCADLSDQQELWEIVRQMYPVFGEILTKDGKLYGVPTDVQAYTFGVNMELWEELGLTEADLPSSYAQLLDFAANWTYDYADEYPDIALFNYGQSSQMLFSLFLSDYLAYTQRKGENTLFDTPAYRAFLKAFEAVDFTEIDSLMEEGAMYLPSDKALFSIYTVVVPMNYQEKAITPLFLSVAEGEEPFLTGSVTVMVINPKTARMDDALLYMKNYLANLPREGANITLFPGRDEPVEQRGYQKSLDEMRLELAKANERLETADEANKPNLRDTISALEENIAELENHRYSVTAEQIAYYRETLEPLMYVQRQNILYSADNQALTEINTLMMQYLGGALDADRMITELDNRLRLMAMEDD